VQERLLEVGHVVRAHGLRGEVVVRLVSNVAERMSPGSALWCKGSPVVVEKSRTLPGKRDGREDTSGFWLVSFAGVSTREEAEQLAGAELHAEAREQGGGLWVHELIGSEVWSISGQRHGRVTAVQANPASDLLVLEDGALVPLRFVVDAKAGRVMVDAPEGLFEL
jgi:16S rRNA processing protein RimM